MVQKGTSDSLLHYHLDMSNAGDDARNAKAKNAKDFKTREVKEVGYTFPIQEGGRNERRVTVSKFHGKVRVDIREYYLDGDEWKPGKKGISLDAKQWENLAGFVELINEAIEELS